MSDTPAPNEPQTDSLPVAHAVRALAESAWALRPEVLATMAAVVRGELPSAALASRAAGQVEARRGGVRTAGGAVAVISVSGILQPRGSFLLELLFGISGGTTTRVRDAVRQAVSDPNVGAIVLDVDSPGGQVDGIPELAAELRAARDEKPLVAVANTMAASAAYWIATQASELYVSPSGAVGSIGVYTAHEDWSKFDDRIGVKTTLISAGKYKTEGNPFEPLSESARAAAQARIDDFYAMFVDDVAAGRKISSAAVREGFGEGRMVLATHAVADGMADRVGTLDDAVQRAAQLAQAGGGALAETDPTPAIADVVMPPASAGDPTPAPDQPAQVATADPRILREFAAAQNP